MSRLMHRFSADRFELLKEDNSCGARWRVFDHQAMPPEGSEDNSRVMLNSISQPHTTF